MALKTLILVLFPVALVTAAPQLLQAAEECDS